MSDGYCDQHYLVQETHEKVCQIHTAFFGNPDDKDDPGGMRATVAMHESALRTIRRIGWIVLGVVIPIAVIALFSLGPIRL